MTQPANDIAPANAPQAGDGRRRWLDVELRRLRKLLERRVLWLRRQWQPDPLQSYGAMVISDVQADSLLAESAAGAERHFYENDESTRALTREIDLLQQERARDGSPLGHIQRIFGLTDFDADALMLCAAPELDPSIDRLYAYVQDDATRRFATAHLALSLFGSAEDRFSLLNRFDSNAPLLRAQLITADATTPVAAAARALTIQERVLRYLLGADAVDSRVAPMLTSLAAGPLPSCQSTILERLVHTLRAGQADWHRLNLVCAPAAGAGSFTLSLCRQLSVRAQQLDPSKLPPPGPPRDEMLRLIERDAMLSQFVLYVDCDDGAADWEWTDRLGVFVVLRSATRLTSKHRALTLALPSPGAASAAEMWATTLAERRVDPPDGLDEIAQQFTFPPERIPRIAGDAIALADFDGRTSPSSMDLWRACRQHADRQLDGLARRLELQDGWDELVLPDDILAQLREIELQVRHRHQVHEGWGFGRRLQRGRGVAALFAGQSGTGKTMAAEVLARALDLDLYRIDLASVVSKYIGETEKNLKRLFDAAEHGGAILFFDEADALFGKRTEVKDSHDRYANIEVNYLLQRMEDYRGLAVLATNRKGALDRAFLRRLRFLVDFPFPDFDARRRIWQKSFPPEAPLADISFDALARLEIAGGSIRNVGLTAAFLAAADGGVIHPHHVERAARREFAKIDQVFPEGLI